MQNNGSSDDCSPGLSHQNQDSQGHGSNSDVRLLSAAADFVRSKVGRIGDLTRSTGIVLGSGLGAPAERLLNMGGIAIAFGEIPGMPVPRVPGHSGRLVTGTIDQLRVWMLQGRVHHYEGVSTAEIVFATQLLVNLGIRELILTNAAGAIHADFRVGDLMLIEDHLRPPGCGLELRTLPDRDMSDNAIRKLRHCLWNTALLNAASTVPAGLRIHRGVYGLMTGPAYETPAEIRMMKMLGADVVGMSTVPEALNAALQGVPVLGISCITNMAAGLTAESLVHSHVTAAAASVEADFTDWIWRVITRSRTSS